MLSAARPPRARGLSARLYILLLVVAVLAPVLLLAGILGQRLMQAERARFEGDVTASTRAVAAVIERELAGLTDTLEALAASPSLATGDLQEFHQQAASLNGTLGISTFLRDAATGRQIVNSLVPWGQPLATRSSLAAWDAQLRASPAPIVSDHYIGITGGQHSFAVAIAVHDAQQRVAYLLHQDIPAERLRAVLAGIELRPGWVAALVDRKGVVLARSRKHAETVGQRATLADSLSRTPGDLSGHMLDREAREVFYAVRRSALSGWSVFVSAPTEDVELPLRRMQQAGILGSALLLSGSLLIAWWLGSRLARSVQSLAESGEALEQQAGPGHGGNADPRGERGGRGAGPRRPARGEADRRQHLMLQELNHRVKNTLATVQALAALTARETTDLSTYRSRLVERLSGLARTHALLTEANWQGAELADLLRSELSIHDSRPRSATARIALEGPPVSIPAAKAPALGMVIHELATNAAKYGALSVPEGRLRVSWTRSCRGDAGEPMLDLLWDEVGGPPVTPPTCEGFGTRMIRQGLARQLGATVRTDFAPAGLRLTLSMPLEAVEQDRVPSMAVN